MSWIFQWKIHTYSFRLRQCYHYKRVLHKFKTCSFMTGSRDRDTISRLAELVVGCSLGGQHPLISDRDRPKTRRYPSQIISRVHLVIFHGHEGFHDFRFCLRGTAKTGVYVIPTAEVVLGFHRVCMLIEFVIFMQTRQPAKAAKEYIIINARLTKLFRFRYSLVFLYLFHYLPPSII